jgi:DNA/RNA-binding domain of Phe-tRNA-synthetase-like protein
MMEHRTIMTNELLLATEWWKEAFTGAAVGVLVMHGLHNPGRSPALDARKRELEESLRAEAARIGREGIGARPRVRAYLDYYRAHGKTYHVKAQWESVAVKGKPIPSRAALVEAMFMAELKNLVLTAGHDLEAIAPPLRVEVTREGDRYVLMNGSERVLGAGDMMMVDGEGIVSSVLHGPDRRTRITPETREALFAVYAPAGVGEDAVREHLDDIRANVLLVAPEGETSLLATLTAA